MFIGRERELTALEELYQSNRFEFVVLYGRRRVGKTALINQFLEHKESIYFMGVESNSKQNLENLSQSILDGCTGLITNSTFLSFQAALEYVFQLATTKRIILAIDEYPYVARSTKSFASTLQLLIDRYKETSRLMLIVCGSSMSYMEDEVLAYKAPLYGRRTAQMKLLPFNFKETCQCFTRFNGEELATIYGMLGGTPQYLCQVNEQWSVEENIKKIFLNPISFIYEEPSNLLKQEVREPAIYNAIITAIANGSSKMSEISTKVGEPTNICSVYIKSLLTLGILRKEIPYKDPTGKKALYTVEDPMFRFWYRFIPEVQSLIARGAIDFAYKRIEPFLSEYMGKIFEEICTQYLWNLLLTERCSVCFTSLGRWWGNDALKHKQTEIDIMGEQDSTTALFAECKWTNEKVDVSVLTTLLERGSLFHYKQQYFYIFSKTGFTKGCQVAAKENDKIHLISFDEMMKDFNEN